MSNPNPDQNAGGNAPVSPARFHIEDMNCASCAKRIENAVLKLPGVVSVKIALETKQAEVAFDPGRLDAPKIQEQITSAGYGCVVLS